MSSNKQPSENLPKDEQQNEAAEAESGESAAKLSMADLLALKKQRNASHPTSPHANFRVKKVGDGPRGSRRSMGKR